jgi:hypothetical protein
MNGIIDKINSWSSEDQIESSNSTRSALIASENKPAAKLVINWVPSIFFKLSSKLNFFKISLNFQNKG